MTRFHTSFTDYVAPSGWRLSTALETLDISTERFNHKRNPNADGYSHTRVLAINPKARLWSVPVIAAHEMAHIVLGHTDYISAVEEMGLPKEAIPFAQFELEAHKVAKAVGYGLQLSTDEFPVDLVQQYIDAFVPVVKPLDDADAVRLAHATLVILEAGERRVTVSADDVEIVG